jgi:hypothetical protein
MEREVKGYALLMDFLEGEGGKLENMIVFVVYFYNILLYVRNI